ncbi:MAG: SPFH domain-containing protein, partial [Luteitalea sp.]
MVARERTSRCGSRPASTFSSGSAPPSAAATRPSTAWRRATASRSCNFESARLKVNDLDGNPIEIAAVVVWRVVDTAEAVFEVDDYNNYV